MEMLFLYGRESMGSRTRDTFSTCSIQKPPKHNNSLQLNPQSVDSDHGYLALTTLAIFAPGGYNQLAKGNSENFEAGQHDSYRGPRYETHKGSLWQGTASISEFDNAGPQLKDTDMLHYTSGEIKRYVNRRQRLQKNPQVILLLNTLKKKTFETLIFTAILCER